LMFLRKVLYSKRWMDNPSNLKAESEKMANIRLIVLTIALIAVIAVASVGTALYYQGATIAKPSPSPSASSVFPITLTDDMNNTVTLNAYPQRIVSLAPANTQIVFVVGAGDKVVGVTDFDNYPYNFSAWIEAGNMSSIGNYYAPAVEPIVSLNPDLILASLGSAEAADQLRSLGYHVLTLNPPDLPGIMTNMLTIGKATNHTALAEAQVSEMQQRINAVVSKVSNVTTRPEVYVEVGADPYYSVGKGTFIDDLITLAGGQNIFENATTAYPAVGSEEIISQNPDVIVVPSSMGIDYWKTNPVTDRPGWGAINAVQNGKLYVINGDIINQPGPRQVDALEYLAQMIHPEIFGNYTDQQ
jgi:iron complex transport system substrate-binding protein